jgi:hypothetical protein
MVAPASVVRQMPNPVAADVAGETVLMNLQRNRCYGLGEIGTEIWGKLGTPVKVSELVAYCSERYEALPGVIEHDVLDMLNQWAEEGLIEVSESSGT